MMMLRGLRLAGRTARIPLGIWNSLEFTAFLATILVGSGAYLSGLLSIRGASVCTLFFVLFLIVRAWRTFDGGRHPCCLFLCLILLFQGGRLLAFVFGLIPDPFVIDLFTPTPFDVSARTSAIFLLSICLSSLFIYIPCRWGYRLILTQPAAEMTEALPYLYTLFYLTLPAQVAENYLFYRYASTHGGYLSVYIDRAGLIASSPRPLHLITLVAMPAFLAIFAVDAGRARLHLATALYLLAATPMLLLGSRSGVFRLCLVLWYISRLKTLKRPRIYRLTAAVFLMGLLAVWIGNLRADDTTLGIGSAAASAFLVSQGNTMEVTELAIQYRNLFRPYAWTYASNQLEGAFIAGDQSDYRRGSSLASDLTVFLNPGAYGEGLGTGSSYLAEAYVAAGIIGVMAMSFLLGVAFDQIHKWCVHPLGVFFAAVTLPTMLWMARSGLFEWIAPLLRDTAFAFMLFLGWKVCALIRLGLSRVYVGGMGFDDPNASPIAGNLTERRETR